MSSHAFDPVSAILAFVALVAGVLVMAGSTLPFDAEVGPWLAAIALVFGVLLLLPLSARRHAPHTAATDTSATDTSGSGDGAVE